MKKTITLLFATFIIVNISNAQIFLQTGIDLDGEAALDYSGVSVSMPDINTIAIGATHNNGNGNSAGHVRIYRWNPSNGRMWGQKGIDIDGEAPGDYSGWSVSMPDSNTVAIGTPYNNGNGFQSGHVRIYRWNPANGGTWVQKGTDINSEATGDGSGWSVSMPDSNTIAIGAPFNDGNGTNAGHVRIYIWNPANGGTWAQKGSDIDGETTHDWSGRSVSMPDSNTVAIGTPYNNGNGISAGHVRIYHWNPVNGGTWMQKGIDIDGDSIYSLSGTSVSMPNSNTIAIGGTGNGNFGGYVRIYSWNGSAWVQKGIDIDGEALGDNSGYSVCMPDSNFIGIGAILNNGNGIESGHVRIYRWNGSAWVQKGSDIDGEAASDNSGFSVSMPDSNTVAIGAYLNDGNEISSGHTRVYSIINYMGVLENNFGNTLTVYPNPTNGELNIDLGSNYNNVSVSVSNVLGQIVHTKNFSNSSLLQLNIPGEVGVYFIEVKSGDKKAILKVMKK
ncbi:MAG: T9SS type A sorting domain-containing protein [Bacteroidetes bacterium]|nr:T9SS type A sorting domain-containing protein [Bacteroidota bacterium]